MVAEEGGTMHQSTVLLYGPDDLTHVIFTSGAEPDAMAHDLEKVARAWLARRREEGRADFHAGWPRGGTQQDDDAHRG